MFQPQWSYSAPLKHLPEFGQLLRILERQRHTALAQTTTYECLTNTPACPHNKIEVTLIKP